MSCLDNVSQCYQCIKPNCIIDFLKRSVRGANIGKLFAERNLDVVLIVKEAGNKSWRLVVGLRLDEKTILQYLHVYEPMVPDIGIAFIPSVPSY